LKIAFVTSQVITAHATMKRALGMAPILAGKGHEVHVILERHPDNAAAFGRDPRVRLHFFENSRSREERRLKREALVRIVPHVTHICGLGWRNALRTRGLDVVKLMDHVELESAITGSGLARRMRQWLLERWSIGAHDGLVVASRYLERWATDRVSNRERVLYLPYAHETGSWGGSSYWPDRFAGRKIVLYSGGWWENYGFHEMLRAAEVLLRSRNDFVFVLSGRGPEEASGRAWIRDQGLQNHVHLVGYLPSDELEGLMDASTVFLSPLRDTVQDRARCPSKIFLYMQHRRPIVTASVGEALEYFSDCRFHYQSGDYYQMARVVGDALDAGDNWSPNYDPTLHTWRERVDCWEAWVARNWRAVLDREGN
jgi:glycosyltransferase involved in cell wall biosynthesis